MNKGSENILLFDGICNLCNGAVRFVIERDPARKFKFAALQSVTGRQWLEKMGLTEENTDSFVFIQGDHYYLRSSAALRVLKEIGGGWKIFYVFMIIPKPLRDFVYNLVARSRYRIFGKRETCMVPTPDLQDRFI
jgi:predicted DCC family thiol-disulfide oxidoreductase YuxK